MYRPQFILRSLDPSSSYEQIEWSAGQLLEALFAIDLDWLAEHGAPPIYGSGVRYIGEGPSHTAFRDIPEVLARGGGDCEDLSCWRAAELVIVDGVDARPVAYVADETPAGLLIHVVVDTPWGIEDPSAELGMGGASLAA